MLQFIFTDYHTNWYAHICTGGGLQNRVQVGSVTPPKPGTADDAVLETEDDELPALRVSSRRMLSAPSDSSQQRGNEDSEDDCEGTRTISHAMHTCLH